MGTESNTSVVREMAYRYNQLYLTPQKGMSGTPEYFDIVQYGKLSPEMSRKIETEGLCGFKGSGNDRLFSEVTPAGRVEVVYLDERSDFERFLQIMAYGCEPVKVAPRIESAEILGVTNWRRIEEHMNRYIEENGNRASWRDELKRFTRNRTNYQDSIIVVGGGGYCEITAEEAGFDSVIWDEVSFKIKTYSSCARYIIRRLFSEYRNIVWEEMLSDCIGLLFAFNKYDVSLAKKFFGVSGKGYDRHGKLINFCGEYEYSIDQLAVRVSEAIEKLGSRTRKLVSSGISDYYEVLFSLEENMNDYVSVIKG